MRERSRSIRAFFLTNNETYYGDVLEFLRTQMPTSASRCVPPRRWNLTRSRGKALGALVQILFSIGLLRRVLWDDKPVLLVCQSAHYAVLIAAGVARLFGRRVEVFIFNFLLRERMLAGVFGIAMRLLLGGHVGVYANAPNEARLLHQLNPATQVHYYPYCQEELPGVTQDDSELGDFVFSGGTTNRDYGTLFRSAALLPDLRFVVIRSASNDVEAAPPSNVECFEDATIEDFHRTMARARIVVVSLDSAVGSSGQMVALAAMLLGKVVVYTNYASLSQYFEDGISGIAYEAKNPQDLAAAIRRAVACASDAGGVGATAKLASTTQFSRARYDQELVIGLRNFIDGSHLRSKSD